MKGGNMSNICLIEMQMTRARLEEQKKEIDKKIEAIDVVLEMFENSEQVKNPGKEPRAVKQRAAYGSLTPEEKKKKQRQYYERYRDRKKLEATGKNDTKIDYDNMA
jgi:hypothetical protein